MTMHNDRISILRFFDKQGDQIDCYSPHNSEKVGPIHEIADNEELIGVYGVRNKNSEWLSTFGYIVKVKQ